MRSLRTSVWSSIIQEGRNYIYIYNFKILSCPESLGWIRSYMSYIHTHTYTCIHTSGIVQSHCKCYPFILICIILLWCIHKRMGVCIAMSSHFFHYLQSFPYLKDVPGNKDSLQRQTFGIVTLNNIVWNWL